MQTEQTGKPSVARTARRNLKKKPWAHYPDIYGCSGIAMPSASLPALASPSLSNPTPTLRYLP